MNLKKSSVNRSRNETWSIDKVFSFDPYLATLVSGVVVNQKEIENEKKIEEEEILIQMAPAVNSVSFSLMVGVCEFVARPHQFFFYFCFYW